MGRALLLPVPAGPRPPTFLAHAAALRALLFAQRSRLPQHGPALRRAARLDLTPEEAAAERRLDALRREWVASPATLRVRDYGAGTRAGALKQAAKPDVRRVAEVYARAAASPAWGRFLFRLVRALRPRRVLELGTNLGVSAGHLALALALNDRDRPGGPQTGGPPEEPSRLVTIEGDAGLADLARGGLARLGVAERVRVVTGRFDDVLPDVLDAYGPEAGGPWDLVFLDGHHEEAATLRYWARVRPHLAPGACVAFDDVEPLRPVRRAWARAVREARRANARTEWADLVGLGLLFPGARAGREPNGTAPRQSPRHLSAESHRPLAAHRAPGPSPFPRA